MQLLRPMSEAVLALPDAQEGRPRVVCNLHGRLSALHPGAQQEQSWFHGAQAAA
jgi:hypothetical protein